MSRIFITGSSDGLGLMSAQLLVEQGHSVVLHARNAQRAEETRRRLPSAEAVVTGDLASLQQVRLVADQVNTLGTFDTIIHNAAVGYSVPEEDSFYEEIAKDITPANEIVLIGHATGKSNAADFLKEYLKTHHPDISRRVIATESADLSAVTEPEIEALVKRHMIPVV
jgi:NAD(P)-dependent dehydrogenase (short-subunit alcohol dehydrogenase family)